MNYGSVIGPAQRRQNRQQPRRNSSAFQLRDGSGALVFVRIQHRSFGLTNGFVSQCDENITVGGYIFAGSCVATVTLLFAVGTGHDEFVFGAKGVVIQVKLIAQANKESVLI